MSARGTMTHRAKIERPTTGTDSWGNPGAPVWNTHLADLPCRAWFQKGRELVGDLNVVIEDRRMVCPRDTDIVEGDRVAEVKDRRSRLVFDGPMRIESVGRRKDHLALMLEAV